MDVRRLTGSAPVVRRFRRKDAEIRHATPYFLLTDSHLNASAPPPPPLSYEPNEFNTRRWPGVDWFIPEATLRDDPDTLRRMRLLVVSIALLMPLFGLGASQLLIAGEAEAAQGIAVLLAAVALSACPFLLKFTRSHAVAGIAFCLVLIGLQFYLAVTDAGLADSALYWMPLVPLVAAFLIGPRVAVFCAVLIIAEVLILYEMEVGGYPFPRFSTYTGRAWYTMLVLVSSATFAAGLGWLYEEYTLKRLRRMNTRLQGLQGALEESEARYRSLFENIPVGVYRSSPDGKAIIANEALVSMLGFDSLEELLAFDLEHVYAGKQGRGRFRERMARDGVVNQFEAVMMRRDGRKIFVRENARATFDADGNVLYYEGAVEDITAHRRAKRALRASEERFRALVQHSTDTITVLDEKGVIQFQSPSVLQNLGYEPEQTIGLNVTDLVHPEDRERVARLFHHVHHRNGEFGSVEFRCLHAEGHYVYVESVGTNMLGNRWVGGIVLNSRDVTERKRAEVALVQAKEQAEEVAQMKSAFLANMSHEIRTPLTGILGFADVLAEEVDDEHREFVGLIKRSGKRLLETLNSVLDLARIEADQMEIDLHILDIGGFVEDTVRLLGPLAEEKKIRLETVLDAPEALARIDRGGLNRIINNLVGNAIKFTSEGQVIVRVGADEDHVTLSVEDTGVGIDASFLPSLFEEFKQESMGAERSHEGSGLGLTITRRLVEMMYGEIAVSSEKGVGSTFTVTFPRAEYLSLEALTETEAPDTAEQERPCVLVVDDNFSARLLLERMLRDTCETDTASSASEALRLAAQTEYDLVLLDIHLSDESSGVEVMQKLRKQSVYREVPIVAFTAFALPGDRERFLNMGFSGYLGKPFTKQQLFEVLAEALGEKWNGVLALPATDDLLGLPSATFLSG